MSDVISAVPARAVVVVPVKAFADAKARLASVLSAPDRATLARTMAERVVAAAAPLAVCVACDDRGVAAWAEDLGATVEWTPGLGLNGAVQQAFGALAGAGFDVVIVAHADLPYAAGLARFAQHPDDVSIVPDRHDDGTNVLAVPAVAEFVFSYGPASFARHVAEAERIGRRVRVERLAELQWDVDTPDDLPVITTT